MIRALGRVLSADAQSLVLRVPGWPGHRPGQFAMLQLDPGATRLDPLLPRPMAVYRGSDEELEFRFKVVGRGTRVLSEFEAGARVGVTGPLGNGFEPEDGRAVLVGGGTGIASLYELAVQSRGPTRVLLGGGTRAEIMGLADFQALDDIELEVATEDGSLGHRGRVTELLRLGAGERVSACGPPAMLRSVAELAGAAGARCRVSLEGHMACGFGVCLGCAVTTRTGYRYVCTDGPVFEAEEIDWEAAA